MKVEHFIAPGPFAGAEKLVLDGCAALASAGHDVGVTTLAERRCPQHAAHFIERAARAGIRTRSIHVRRRVDIRAAQALTDAMRDTRPDVLHLHGFKAAAYAVLAKKWSSTVVATHHGRTSHTAQVRVYEALERRLLAAADVVIAVSNATKDRLISEGVPASRVRVVPNFVSDAPLIAPRGDSGRLLFVGRLSPEKGVDLLLQAMASRPETRLTILGDGPARSDLVALTRKLGLESRVRFAGFTQDIWPHLAAATALILPSRREGLPLAVIEALMLGTPVVATDVGGVRSLVRDGLNGVVTPPHSSAELGRGLDRMRANRSRFKARCVFERPAIRARFGSARWVENTELAYAHGLARREAA
jgi:glycosyltransferase involved in cell wall biosynthesis